jgi:KDO2-lipid IV(A) lauroyltransferase
MQKMLRKAARRSARRIKLVVNLVLGRIAILVFQAVRRTDPDRLANLAGPFMRRLGPWLPEHRIGRANLSAAFPKWPAAEVERVLDAVWDNLGRLGAEFVHLDHLADFDPEGREPRRVEFTPASIETFHRLRDDGKPALIFAAHLANWELPALAAASYGLETAVLFRPPNIPDVRRLVLDMRSSRMGMLIPTTIEAPVRIAEAMARGAHAGMLVDQYHGRGVDVTFFGRRTKANPLIARLAKLIDCPLHGTRVVRLPDHRFRVEITEAIAPARDAQGQVDIAATMQIITSIIEGWIREHPEQWLWLHRRWR